MFLAGFASLFAFTLPAVAQPPAKLEMPEKKNEICIGNANALIQRLSPGSNVLSTKNVGANFLANTEISQPVSLELISAWEKENPGLTISQIQNQNGTHNLVAQFPLSLSFRIPQTKIAPQLEMPQDAKTVYIPKPTVEKKPSEGLLESLNNQLIVLKDNQELARTKFREIREALEKLDPDTVITPKIINGEIVRINVTKKQTTPPSVSPQAISK